MHLWIFIFFCKLLFISFFSLWLSKVQSLNTPVVFCQCVPIELGRRSLFLFFLAFFSFFFFCGTEVSIQGSSLHTEVYPQPFNFLFWYTFTWNCLYWVWTFHSSASAFEYAACTTTPSLLPHLLTPQNALSSSSNFPALPWNQPFLQGAPIPFMAAGAWLCSGPLSCFTHILAELGSKCTSSCTLTHPCAFVWETTLTDPATTQVCSPLLICSFSLQESCSVFPHLCRHRILRSSFRIASPRPCKKESF